MSMNRISPDMAPVCRCFVVDGKRTSIRMEREFWKGFDSIRKDQGLSKDEAFLAAVGADKPNNRTAVLKAWVLAQYRGAPMS